MRVGTLGRTVLMGFLFLGFGGMEARAQSQWSVGGGVHYLRNLGDITADGALDFNKNSVALVGSVKGSFGLLSVEPQVGYVFDWVGTNNSLWEPQIWGLIGGFIYGGAGIGIGYTDGDWLDDPFYAIRGGVDLPLGGLELDAYATWRFQSSQDFKDLTGEDLDSITFAALLRFLL